MSELDCYAVISGALADLTVDGVNAENFELHPDTKAEMNVNWRKQTAQNDGVEGSFTTSAVRENIEETLAVWCNGLTSSDVELGIYELTRRLAQLTYTVALTLDGVTYTWTCTSPAQISVVKKHEYLHAPTALVTARLSRLPKATITGTFGTRTT